jgi:hypothetical protein
MTNISIVAIQFLSKFFNSRIVKRALIVSLLWLLGVIPALATEVIRLGAEWDLSPDFNSLELCDAPSNGFTCITNVFGRTMRIVGFAGTLTTKPSAGLSEVLWIINILDERGTPRAELYGAEYVNPQTLNVSVVIPGSGVAVFPGETIAVFLQAISHTSCELCVEAQMAFYWNEVTTPTTFRR